MEEVVDLKPLMSRRRKTYAQIWWRKLFLRFALGRDTFDYLSRCMSYAKDTRGSHHVDLVIRKGGADHGMEADWAKKLQFVATGGKKGIWR